MRDNRGYKPHVTVKLSKPELSQNNIAGKFCCVLEAVKGHFTHDAALFVKIDIDKTNCVVSRVKYTAPGTKLFFLTLTH